MQKAKNMYPKFRLRSIVKYVDNLLRVQVLFTFLLLSLSSFFVSANFESCVPVGTISGVEEPTPPGQSASGPGGKDYPHASVTRNGPFGSVTTQYWIYEPADPIPASAPLIVFNHGGGALNPWSYGAWIEHIVRRGNIVIWSRYQQKPLPSSLRGLDNNVINAVKNAIDELQRGGHVKPELDKFAVTGHSLGASITINMAIRSESVGLPQPKAIMPVMPGLGTMVYPNQPDKWFLFEDFKKIPSDILMLVVIGAEDDRGIGVPGIDTTPQQAFSESVQIPLANKDFVIVQSDRYGTPSLIADHASPVAPDSSYDNGLPVFGSTEKPVDALDYYGFWKLFDALTDNAFYGRNREYAFDNTSEQRFMGLWSDGTPVAELVITDSP